MVQHTAPFHVPDISRRALDAIQPARRNPRLHSARQIKQIARSIQAFGFNVPLLIDRDGVIICGHGRFAAARTLGLAEVPVIELNHLSPEQIQAFSIADNKLTENATWNEALLGEIFAELAALDLTFSLEDTGFAMAEIDLHIEGLSIKTGSPDASLAPGAETAPPDPADQIPEDDAPAVSRLGDLWQLGRHRLLCGNALQAEDLKLLTEGQVAQMVFTDPPYNVPIQGHVSGKGRIRHREFAMACGEMSSAEFTDFLQRAFALMAQHSTPGSLHYVCMDWRHLGQTLAAGQSAYTELKNICVWVKDNGGMGSLYRSQHEFVLVFKHGDAPHRNNIELGRHGRYRTNVWNYPGIKTQSLRSDEGNLLGFHPTVKPIALVADAILDCTARGDHVLDTFAGSGTTLLACERVGRHCLGLELDPRHVDTTIRRWQRLSGEAALHVSSGETFDQRLERAGSSAGQPVGLTAKKTGKTSPDSVSTLRPGAP